MNELYFFNYAKVSQVIRK